MKIMRVLLCAVLLISGALAGGLVTNTNQSAAFMRTLNRNASTDVDAVYFNPAGLTKLCCNGLFIDIANQTIWQTKTVTNSTANLNHEGEYVGKVFAPVFPTAFVAFKMDKLVLSGGFMPIGGGGSAEYEDGLPSFEYTLASLVGVPAAYFNSALSSYGNINGYDLDVNFSGSSIYYGFQGGVSYEINDLLSLSLGGRYVMAKNSYEGHLRDLTLNTTSGGNLTTAILGTALADVEVEASQSGSGIAGIIGVNLSPNENLNIGIRYETITKMELTNDTDKDYNNMFKDDSTFGADMPSQLAIGISYQMDKIKLMSDFNYFGNSGVDWGGAEDNFDNGMEVGLAAEYALSEKLTVSLGGLYSLQGATDKSQTDMDYNLDTFTIGGGLLYAVTPKIKVNLGALNTIYFEGQNATKVEKYNQTTFGFGFGVQVKL